MLYRFTNIIIEFPLKCGILENRPWFLPQHLHRCSTGGHIIDRSLHSSVRLMNTFLVYAASSSTMNTSQEGQGFQLSTSYISFHFAVQPNSQQSSSFSKCWNYKHAFLHLALSPFELLAFITQVYPCLRKE